MKIMGLRHATLLAAFPIIISPFFAAAATFLEQPIYDTEGQSGNYSIYQQVIGTDLSGQLASAAFYLKPAAINGGFNTDLAWLVECDRVQMDIGCASFFSESHKLVEGGASSFETFDFFPAFTFNPAKYYSIQVASPGGWPYGGNLPYQTHIFGAASTTFNGQPCINCLNLSSIFFRLSDTYAPEERLAEQTLVTATVSQLGYQGYPTQSFTPTESGTIKSVAVASPVACGVIVSDGQFAAARFDGGQQILGGSRFTGGAFPVTAGQIYYLTFLCDESFDLFSGTTVDSYPGGEAGQGNMPGAGDINFASNASVGNALLDWAFTVCTGTNCTLVPLQDTAPTIGNLQQLRQFSASTIPAGGDFIGNGITLQADVTDTDSTQVTLEVEVKPVGVAFDGTGVQRLTSNLPTGTTTISIAIDNLALIPEQYAGDTTHAFHWRVRAVDFEEHASEWQEFSPSATSFSVTHTLGFHATELAKQVLNADYLGDGKTYGGKGWHYDQDRYVSKQEIFDKYVYWNNAIGAPVFDDGLDCSGLVMWSFNRSYNPNLDFKQNAVRAEGANGQYLNITYTIPAEDLKPGDLLFFGTTTWKTHVAMYVGEFESNGEVFDVVEAESPESGIVPSRAAELMEEAKFVGLDGTRRIAFGTGIAGYLQGGSPIDLTVTDPDGFVISATTSIQTDQEFLREVTGELYYSEMIKGHDGRPAPIVYWPKQKAGTYHILVTPQYGVSPSDTYSIIFTNGSTTVELARDLPVNQIPSGGYRVTVAANGAVTVDAVPPEVRIGFDILTKTIQITGMDAVSSTTISTTATSSTIVDTAGNWLSLKLSNAVQKPSYASLSVPSFSYSTGTTTSATTTLRYFWSTNTAGEYALMVSAIRTPTDRAIWLYVRPLNKTYVITATAKDDAADLLAQAATLLLRKKVQTYNGMIVPYVKTDRGSILVGH